jgi:hypothetical protein
MSLIETLTPEQIARFAEFRDRWIEIGLCTEPADRPRAEAAIREMYRQGGLEPPKKIVWCGSPLSQGLTFAIILDRKLTRQIWASDWDNIILDKELTRQIRDSVWDNVRDSVEDSVWDRAWGSIRDSLGDNVTTSVWDNVDKSALGSVWNIVEGNARQSAWDSVFGSVKNSVWDSVGRNILIGVRDSVWGTSIEDDVTNFVHYSVSYSGYRAHNEAAWLAIYRYYHDVVGLVDLTAKLSGLWELAQSAGWALPYQHICWVSERHNVLARDDRGRLHSLTGPACAYPDGFAIYAVHGVTVPRYVIEQPREIDVARIEAETNAEVRRVMIYRHGENVSGAAAYTRDSGAERLDHDERFGTLWRRNVPDDEPIVMIEVVNSTPEPHGSRKRYWLRVPPNTTTAHDAVAWTFGIPAKDYAPSMET